MNTSKVIEQFKKVHGDLYIYSRVEYIDSREKVKIMCPKHGEFLQTPNSHKSGSGCYSCYRETPRIYTDIENKKSKRIIDKFGLTGIE